jgi:hypothetical protein
MSPQALSRDIVPPFKVERARAQLRVVDAQGYIACIVPLADAPGAELAQFLCAAMNKQATAHV